MVAAAALTLASAAARGGDREPVVLGSAEVAAGGGYDTNMFLQVSPDPATREAVVGGWYQRAAPRLLAAAVTGGGWRFEGAYRLDYRRSEGAGHLIHQELELGLVFRPLGPLAATVAATAGRFDAPDFSEDRFLFAAAEAGLRLELTPRWRAAASYRAELRRYPDPARAETDLVQLGELALAYRPGPVGRWYLAIAPFRAAGVDDGTLRSVRAGPEVELVRGRFGLDVGGWGGSLEVSGREREWQLGATATALLRLTGYLDVAASFEWSAAPWASDQVRAGHERRYFLLSFIGHASGRTALRARRREETSLRPVVTAGQVRFRMRAPPAATVQVIGSWDEWKTPGPPLAPSGDPGLFEVSLTLPPGSHRYRFVVDGSAVKPPDAPRYATDDFGESDGVIDVENSSK